eukprot:jgi/Mesvir1/28163/Mv04725-RA.1
MPYQVKPPPFLALAVPDDSYAPMNPLWDLQASFAHFENFYVDCFYEMAKYGELEDIVAKLCYWGGSFWIPVGLEKGEGGGGGGGGVVQGYAKFATPEACRRACDALQGRYFERRPIHAEVSVIENLHAGICNQNARESSCCAKEYLCNYIHMKKCSQRLREFLFGRYKATPTRCSPSPSSVDDSSGETCRLRQTEAGGKNGAVCTSSSGVYNVRDPTNHYANSARRNYYTCNGTRNKNNTSPCYSSNNSNHRDSNHTGASTQGFPSSSSLSQGEGQPGWGRAGPSPWPPPPLPPASPPVPPE